MSSVADAAVNMLTPAQRISCAEIEINHVLSTYKLHFEGDEELDVWLVPDEDEGAP